MRDFFQRLGSDQRGAVLVESAFALPVVFLFGFGIIQTSRALWTLNTLQFAVEAAARCAAIDATNCGSDANIKARAVSNSAGIGATVNNFAVSTQTCGRQVTATFAFDAGIPGTSRFSPTLTATSCWPA